MVSGTTIETSGVRNILAHYDLEASCQHVRLDWWLFGA